MGKAVKAIGIVLTIISPIMGAVGFYKMDQMGDDPVYQRGNQIQARITQLDDLHETPLTDATAAEREVLQQEYAGIKVEHKLKVNRMGNYAGLSIAGVCGFFLGGPVWYANREEEEES
jgi:hypothetical protein